MQRTTFRTVAPITAVAAAALAATAAPLLAQSETSRSVDGGGIHVAGWMGTVDAREAAGGLSLDDARLAEDNGVLHVTTGPATTYWNPANRATGSYMVSATFHEPEYMNLNDHPHPYGIVVGGNDMGTDSASYLYCAAYGNGRFIVRGFGPEPFQMNGRRPEENAAVHQAAGQGQPVTQEISVMVMPNEVSCSINGTIVASYPRSELVMDGKLSSTDGVYGVRFAHNTEATVTNLRMMAH